MLEIRETAKLADLSGDEVSAIQREAARGNPAALFIIGVAYCRGDCFARDREKGMRLLEIAASAGHRPAVLELSLIEAGASHWTPKTRNPAHRTLRSGVSREEILGS